MSGAGTAGGMKGAFALGCHHVLLYRCCSLESIRRTLGRSGDRVQRLKMTSVIVKGDMERRASGLRRQEKPAVVTDQRVSGDESGGD